MAMLEEELNHARATGGASSEAYHALSVKAAALICQKQQLQMEFSGLVEVFHHWKRVYWGAKEQAHGEEKEDIRLALETLKRKAAETVAAKALSSWCVSSIGECFHHWHQIAQTRKTNTLETSREDALHTISVQRHLAAEAVLRKATQYWEHVGYTEGFMTWMGYVKAERVQRLEKQLKESVEEQELLADKVERLQRKLDKAATEKKALLEEVNRHVGLLL